MSRKREKTSSDLKSSKLSYKQMLRLYRQIKIPWIPLILTGAAAVLMKQINIWVVPYTTRLQGGDVTGTDFLIGYIGLTLLANVWEGLQGGIQDLTSQMTARNVRNTVWGKLLHLPMSWYDDVEPQGLVSRVTKDTEGVFAALSVLVQMISVGWAIYASFAQMFKIYKSLALIMLTGIPMTLLSAWIVGKFKYKMINIENNSLAKITNYFAERLPNVMRIKTAGMETKEYDRGVQANQERYRAQIKEEILFIVSSPMDSFAQYVNQAILLLVASALVRQGTMRHSQMLNLYNYFLTFMGNAILISAVWQGIKQAHGSATTIAKIVDAPTEDLDSGMPLEDTDTDLRFCDVRFAYNQERQILDGVSFTIPKGKVTAIVGENGCGKSTAIKLLERFNHEQDGSIMVGDASLDEIRLSDWREKVGYLFQGNQIIKGTIRENIAYGVHREFTEEELLEAARQAKAYDFIMGKEDGFDTEISRFDNKCSGGEMQRIAIARVLLKRPQILIMDEATSGIDVVSEQEVLEALMNLMKDKTVIMVSHDIHLIQKADNLIVLKNGKVEASGSYAEVAKNSPLLREFIEKGGAA